MADPAHVHELGEDAAAQRVHRVRDRPPALDLPVGVQAGGAGVPLAGQARLGALADDQSRRRPLGVVTGRQAGTSAGAWTRRAVRHRSSRSRLSSSPVGASTIS